MKGNENNGTQAPKGARLAFGIIMIFVYLGVGLMFILDIGFHIDNTAVSCVIGGLLCAYGVWRAIRLFKGWQ